MLSQLLLLELGDHLGFVCLVRGLAPLLRVPLTQRQRRAPDVQRLDRRGDVRGLDDVGRASEALSVSSQLSSALVVRVRGEVAVAVRVHYRHKQLVHPGVALGLQGSEAGSGGPLAGSRQLEDGGLDAVLREGTGEGMRDIQDSERIDTSKNTMQS